jgi:AcrR family transcriptional regulator
MAAPRPPRAKRASELEGASHDAAKHAPAGALPGSHGDAQRAATNTGDELRVQSGATSESSRRVLVLETALELVSNHGIAGMSLRMLARRLGMQQPSLYHYFASKDELVDQVVEYCAEKMVETVMLDRIPALPQSELPHFVVERTLALWQTERHVRFARLLFVVSIESPKHRPVIRRVFQERLYGSAASDLATGLGGDAQAERVAQSLRMLASALGLTLMEERVLFGLESPSEKTLLFAQFMANAVAELLGGKSQP